jgi:hypothetical protein
MEWHLTQNTKLTLHHERNDALRMVHVGMCAQTPPPFRPIWVEADWASGAIICEGLEC